MKSSLILASAASLCLMGSSEAQMLRGPSTPIYTTGPVVVTPPTGIARPALPMFSGPIVPPPMGRPPVMAAPIVAGQVPVIHGLNYRYTPASRNSGRRGAGRYYGPLSSYSRGGSRNSYRFPPISNRRAPSPPRRGPSPPNRRGPSPPSRRNPSPMRRNPSPPGRGNSNNRYPSPPRGRSNSSSRRPSPPRGGNNGRRHLEEEQIAEEVVAVQTTNTTTTTPVEPSVTDNLAVENHIPVDFVLEGEEEESLELGSSEVFQGLAEGDDFSEGFDGGFSEEFTGDLVDFSEDLDGPGYTLDEAEDAEDENLETAPVVAVTPTSTTDASTTVPCEGKEGRKMMKRGGRFSRGGRRGGLYRRRHGHPRSHLARRRHARFARAGSPPPHRGRFHGRRSFGKTSGKGPATPSSRMMEGKGGVLPTTTATTTASTTPSMEDRLNNDLNLVAPEPEIVDVVVLEEGQEAPSLIATTPVPTEEQERDLRSRHGHHHHHRHHRRGGYGHRGFGPRGYGAGPRFHHRYHPGYFW